MLTDLQMCQAQYPLIASDFVDQDPKQMIMSGEYSLASIMYMYKCRCAKLSIH